MATALQIAANRRNAKKSTGPRTAEGRKRASLSALRHGMTAKTVILPHESASNYNEIRDALIHDYAPATVQELMLVDQIAVGYWRTIRARRFETAMFDNQLRTKKRELAMDKKPDPARDDEGYAIVLQMTGPEDLNFIAGLSCAVRSTWFKAMAPVEPIRFIAHAAPTKLLLQNGQTDELVPVADAQLLQAAAPEPKTIRWYNAGHGLNQQANFDRLDWLHEHIGIDVRQ